MCKYKEEKKIIIKKIFRLPFVNSELKHVIYIHLYLIYDMNNFYFPTKDYMTLPTTILLYSSKTNILLLEILFVKVFFSFPRKKIIHANSFPQ